MKKHLIVISIATQFALAAFTPSAFSQVHSFCLTNPKLAEIAAENAEKVPVSSRGNDVLYIQTVFHCLYNTPADSIPADKIMAIFENLNKVYRRDVNLSIINPIFHSRAADSRIQFCLAQTDPNGLPSTGIVYKKVDVPSYPIWLGGVDTIKNSNLGGDDPWDTNRYLNIWIAAVGGNETALNYGIAWPGYMPIGNLIEPGSIMGAVLDVDIFNDMFSSIFNPDATLAHEVGHALGLRHTHGDPSEPQDACNVDDGISDTPRCAPFSFGKCGDFSVNSCVEPVNDEPDNLENIMYYACSNMITTEQANRMYANLLLPGAPAIFSLAPCGTPLAASEAQPSMDFLLKPNPSNGVFEVVLNGLPSEKVTIQILDVFGKVLKTEHVSAAQGTYHNHGGLLPGAYFLKVQSGAAASTKRFVIF